MNLVWSTCMLPGTHDICVHSAQMFCMKFPTLKFPIFKLYCMNNKNYSSWCCFMVPILENHSLFLAMSNSRFEWHSLIADLTLDCKLCFMLYGTYYELRETDCRNQWLCHNHFATGHQQMLQK